MPTNLLGIMVMLVMLQDITTANATMMAVFITVSRRSYMIKVGSMQWIAKLYNLNTGGVDYKELKKHPVGPPKLSTTVNNPAAHITISAEAKKLWENKQ